MTEKNAIIRIAACSYEGSLFGWNVTETVVEEEDQHTTKKSKFSVPDQLLNQISLVFGFHVSRNSFKAIAVSKNGRYLAVAGGDERIHVFNMQENRAIGEISGHTGGVTSLRFVEDTFLISGSEDHTMYIWRVYDWQHLHILGGHKEAVLDFAVHPSGKIALSISKDHTMRLWNLVQGRCSFTRKLRSTAEHILWHPSGEHYLLVTTSELQLFAVADNSCTFDVKSKSRINHATFLKISETEYRVVYVCDNQTLNMLSLDGELTTVLNLAPIGAGRLKTVTTCSSKGLAKLDIENEDDASLHSDCLVLATSTGCLAVLNGFLLEQPDFKEKGKVEDCESVFGKALYAFDQVRADPRFTAVVAWNVLEVQVKGKKNEKESTDKAEQQVEEIEEMEETIEEEDQQEEVQQKQNQKKEKPVKAAKKNVKFQQEEKVEPVLVKPKSQKKKGKK